MPVSFLRRRSGPAFIHHRGVSFFTKDAITFDPQLEPFTVDDDAYGDLDQRRAGQTVKIQCTPEDWTAAMLGILYPSFITNLQLGQYNTPYYDAVTCTVAAPGVFTFENHGQITGTGVRFDSTGTLPTGLVAATTYYLFVIDENTFKLSDTEAHALAGTNFVAITVAGSGDMFMVQNTPTTVQYLDAAATYITLWNTGITKMPDLDLSAVKTPYGAMEFEGYVRYGMSASDDDSIFTINTGGTLSAVPNSANIPTVPYTVAFGDATPFSDLQPRDGVSVGFSLKWDKVKDDANGVICQRLIGLEVTVKLRPLGVLDSDVLGEINIQGTGAQIGASLASNALTIAGPESNPYFQIPAASLMNGPLKIGTKEDRIGDLNFKSKRAFVDGAPLPIFVVGVAAP
jgi:hypothetical protein